MVGLMEFGDAAWALEQLLNSWLADQKVASHDFLALCTDALKRFEQWANDIEAKRDGGWLAISAHPCSNWPLRPVDRSERRLCGGLP